MSTQVNMNLIRYRHTRLDSIGLDEFRFVLTDGRIESSETPFKILISGESSGEIHFHSMPIEVREGECAIIEWFDELRSSKTNNNVFNSKPFKIQIIRGSVLFDKPKSGRHRWDVKLWRCQVYGDEPAKIGHHCQNGRFDRAGKELYAAGSHCTQNCLFTYVKGW